MTSNALLRPRSISMLLFAALGIAATSAQAADDRFSGGWHGAFTLYGWLPSASGDLRFDIPGTGTATTKSDSSALEHLEGALMIQGEVRNGEWGFFGDADWVKFGNQDGRFTNIGGEHIGASANLDSSWDMKGGMITLAGLYNINNGPWGFNDILFGGRYLWIKSNLSWDFQLQGNGGLVDIENSGHVSRQTHATDAVVGLRGRWNIGGGNWFVPYYFDVGAGDDTFTGQILVGVGYAFDWGGMTFAWRHVQYEQDDDSELLKRVALDGPAFGLTWLF